MKTRIRGAILLIGAALVLRAIPASAQQTAVAIVTHPEAPVSNLSSAQLRSIFLGEQQFWSNKSKITLLVRAPAARERDLVLNRIYRMSEPQFRQYWIAKMFRAEVAAGPKIFYSNDMARGLVAAIPGAITFMPAADVGTGLKVLRIDGKLPSDPGYPLK